MHSVNILVEGITDEAVAKRLLEHAGLAAGSVYGRSGKADLLKRLAHYNQSARFLPWFVILDLDNDAPCASQAIGLWLPERATGMCARVAVHEIESWLMADAERMSEFLYVPVSKLPYNPDSDLNPKLTLVNVARRSRNRNVREDMVPRQGSGAVVGPGYTEKIVDFARKYWRPAEAARRSESLRRCIKSLSSLAEME